MADHKINVRTPWHRTAKGCWSLSLTGGKYTVRVTQRTPGAVFERIMVLGKGAQDWVSLGTTDRIEAEECACRLLHALLGTASAPAPAESSSNVLAQATVSPVSAQHEAPTSLPVPTPISQSVLTLGRLVTIYEEGNTFKKLDPKTQADYRSNARILIGYFGAEQDVTTLCTDDLDGYELRRRAGGIVYDAPRPGAPDLPVEPKRTKAAGPRAVGADLTYLRTILNWARKNRGPDGKPYLKEFPIVGMTIPKNKNPVRSWGDYERFCLLLRAIQELTAAAEEGRDPVMSRQYRYLELALVIAEVTGRRISAVVQLWRSDFEFDAHNDFANATIRWRAATDKMGVTRTLPLDPHIARALHGLVSRFEVVGDVPLFAQVRNRNRAVAASELGKWLTQAEEIAGLEKLPGGRWHPWRRYWASQRTEGSVDQIMAAGGWEDFRTFKNSYRKLDRDTAIKVLNEPAARRLADGRPAHPLYPTVGQPPSQPSGPGRPGVPALSLVRRRPGPGRSA